MKKYLTVLLVTLVLGCVAIYFFFPQALLGITYKVYEFQAGVTKKSMLLDGQTIHYYDGGKGENLVMIHGYGDSKMSFLLMSRFLSGKYRVIFPDLLGSGETPYQPKKNHGISSQAQFLRRFLKKLKIKTFYLLGHSMGGHISTTFALQNPTGIKKLLLLNAAGLKVDNFRPYREHKRKKFTVKDYEMFLDKVFVKRPFAPKPVLTYLTKKAIKDFPNQQRMARDIRADKFMYLNDKLSPLKVPTKIFWCDKDRIVPLRVGKLYHKLIPHSKWHLWKNCGHAPQYEIPQKTAKAILSYLKN